MAKIKTSGKKVFRIGECAVGGIIVAEFKGNKLTLICQEWDYSAGYTHRSNQSNAKEIYSVEIISTNGNGYREAYAVLSEWTTHYWAETIIKWVEDNGLKLSRSMWV